MGAASAGPGPWLQPEWASAWTRFTLSFSAWRSLRAGADAYSVKNDFFVFILKALSTSTLGFASSGVKCHRRTFPTRSAFDSTAPRLSNTSNLQRSLPKCVFPPVDNWDVISVK